MKLRLVAFALSVAVSAPALAADVVPIIQPPPQERPFEGFYLGGHAGYGWANRSGCAFVDSIFFHHNYEIVTIETEEENECFRLEEAQVLQLNGYGYGFPFDYDQKGWILGGQAGYNHFLGGSNFMIGAEVSASLSGITGNLDLGEFGAFLGLNGVGDWTYLGTATGKLGFALNKLMVYGEVGLGLGGFRYNSQLCNFESNHQGLVYGAGAEVALNANNSLFVEWNHFAFNEKTAMCGIPVLFALTVETKPKVDVVKFGFNHFFN
jgi:outer membrane immunogenic protein